MRRLLALLCLAIGVPLLLGAAPARDWTRTVVRNPAGAYVIGNPAAPIKLVEWESYTCPHCAAFARESQATLTGQWIRNGSVSLEVRHLVRDSADLAAAVVARCTGARGFFAASTAMFDGQEAWVDRASQFQQNNAQRIGLYPPLARLRAIADGSGLSDIGRVHGLTDQRLDACFADQAEIDRIVAMANDAQGVTGTPTFFVGGQRLDGFTWARIEPLLRAAAPADPTGDPRPMKSLILAAAAALALAGCSKGDSGGNGAAPAGPVAAKAAPAGQSWTDVVVKTPEGYRVGNPDAAIKVAEYGSRLCPTCGAFAREGYEPLMKNYVGTGKVSFEFREFLVHGAPDLPPSLLGNCVPPATFFPLLEAMYQNQQGFNDKLMAAQATLQDKLKNAKPPEAVTEMANTMGLVDFVKQRGLPEAKARACLADMSMIDKLTKQTQDKSADGTVSGTPTFLVNGKVAAGVITWGQLEQALKAAGA